MITSTDMVRIQPTDHSCYGINSKVNAYLIRLIRDQLGKPSKREELGNP